MTNFSQRPTRDGLPVVNHADGGKRPRSTQSPTLVFNPDGTLRLVVGSPGGGRIINYVAKTLIAVLDWKLDVQSAISLPHVIDRRGRVELERNTDAVQFQKKFEEKGHKIRIRHLTSGLHGIEITPEGLIGGADPRREGIVMGE
jgi:gamma-glutamyltranspeptidase/glutathione hydrolase